MFRIDDATAASSLPAPEAAGTEGYFTEGNPTAGTPATNVRGSWLNMIQEELSAVLAAAGVTRSKTTYNQVNTALKSMYSSVVGSARNLAMSVPTASATATMTADEIIVETALGGQTYRIASFSKTINLAITGAGGMDTGTAPASGFVALYAIYNPTTGTSALLATNATASIQPNVYGGANMPAGFTASALLAVWLTNSSSLLVVGNWFDRTFVGLGATILATSTQTSSYTSLSIAGVVPKNAKFCSGNFNATNGTAAAGTNILLAASSAGIGPKQKQYVAPTAGAQYTADFANLQLATPQTIFYQNNTNTGTLTVNLAIMEYTI